MGKVICVCTVCTQLVMQLVHQEVLYLFEPYSIKLMLTVQGELFTLCHLALTVLLAHMALSLLS